MRVRETAGVAFETEIQARFRDINLGGHVDNVEAIRIIDEARILFLRFAEEAVLAEAPAGIAELMGSQRVDYHAEMRFVPFQPFHLRLWISRFGRSSFDVVTELRVLPGHDPALVARTSMVMWDHASGASWPLSDAVRARLEDHLAPPVALREG